MMDYAQPSIVEALCEIVLSPTSRADLTVFGRFEERVRAQLPVSEQGEIVTVNMAAGSEGLKQDVQRSPRMRFFSPDRSRLAQIGRDLVAANVLPPYPGWQAFKKFILETFRAYEAVASPTQIERMTLRYLDKISVQLEQFELRDWVAESSPYVPAHILSASDRAMSSTQRTSGSTTEIFGLQVDITEDVAIIAFDTQIVRSQIPLDLAQIEEILEQQHREAVMIFESCISKKYRHHLDREVE